VEWGLTDVHAEGFFGPSEKEVLKRLGLQKILPSGERGERRNWTNKLGCPLTGYPGKMGSVMLNGCGNKESVEKGI